MAKGWWPVLLASIAISHAVYHQNDESLSKNGKNLEALQHWMDEMPLFLKDSLKPLDNDLETLKIWLMTMPNKFLKNPAKYRQEMTKKPSETGSEGIKSSRLLQTLTNTSAKTNGSLEPAVLSKHIITRRSMGSTNNKRKLKKLKKKNKALKKLIVFKKMMLKNQALADKSNLLKGQVMQFTQTAKNSLSAIGSLVEAGKRFLSSLGGMGNSNMGLMGMEVSDLSGMSNSGNGGFMGMEGSGMSNSETNGLMGMAGSGMSNSETNGLMGMTGSGMSNLHNKKELQAMAKLLAEDGDERNKMKKKIKKKIMNQLKKKKNMNNKKEHMKRCKCKKKPKPKEDDFDEVDDFEETSEEFKENSKTVSYDGGRGNDEIGSLEEDSREAQYNEGRNDKGRYNEGRYNNGRPKKGRYNNGRHKKGRYNNGRHKKGRYNNGRHKKGRYHAGRSKKKWKHHKVNGRNVDKEEGRQHGHKGKGRKPGQKGKGMTQANVADGLENGHGRVVQKNVANAHRKKGRKFRRRRKKNGKHGRERSRRTATAETNGMESNPRNDNRNGTQISGSSEELAKDQEVGNHKKVHISI